MYVCSLYSNLDKSLLGQLSLGQLSQHRSFEFVWVVVPSDYFVSTQLQLWLFWRWAVTRERSSIMSSGFPKFWTPPPPPCVIKIIEGLDPPLI